MRAPKASGLAERLDGALEAIDDAGLGLGSWFSALEQVRDLTGSHVAQVSEIGKPSAAPFTWTTQPHDLREFIEAGGPDLRVNSRRRAIPTMPLLTVRDEPFFDTEGDSQRYPAWGDFLRRWDYPYVCVTPVTRSFGVTTVLSITRASARGGLDAEEKRLFAVLARRVRHAVRTQNVLRQRTLERLVATFDQRSQAVFACSGDGDIVACTAGGEALLRAGDRLLLASGRLKARSRQASDWLSGAMARACGDPATVAASPGIVHDAHGERPMVLEITPLPTVASDVWGSNIVLVVARELDPTRAAARLARLAAATMGFTPAEEAVARHLLAGHSPAQTAAALRIAVGTVRVHVRSLYAKTGVRNQLAFAALMGALR